MLLSPEMTFLCWALQKIIVFTVPISYHKEPWKGPSFLTIPFPSFDRNIWPWKKLFFLFTISIVSNWVQSSPLSLLTCLLYIPTNSHLYIFTMKMKAACSSVTLISTDLTAVIIWYLWLYLRRLVCLAGEECRQFFDSFQSRYLCPLVFCQ